MFDLCVLLHTLKTANCHLKGILCLNILYPVNIMSNSKMMAFIKSFILVYLWGQIYWKLWIYTALQGLPFSIFGGLPFVCFAKLHSLCERLPLTWQMYRASAPTRNFFITDRNVRCLSVRFWVLLFWQCLFSTKIAQVIQVLNKWIRITSWTVSRIMWDRSLV